eukprot:1999949-Rhodomonas_salina.1
MAARQDSKGCRAGLHVVAVHPPLYHSALGICFRVRKPLVGVQPQILTAAVGPPFWVWEVYGDAVKRDDQVFRPVDCRERLAHPRRPSSPPHVLGVSKPPVLDKHTMRWHQPLQPPPRRRILA